MASQLRAACCFAHLHVFAKRGSMSISKSLLSKVASIILFILGIFISGISFSQVVVMGHTIGQSTTRDLLGSPEGRHMREAGINEFSGGRIYHIQGNHYDIAGLKSVVYTFDQQDKLVAVLLTMDKNRFNSIRQILNENYRVVDEKVPFVGDKYVSYISGNVQIWLNAPHLSFEMTITYITDSLAQKIQQEVERSQQETRRRESSRF